MRKIILGILTLALMPACGFGAELGTLLRDEFAAAISSYPAGRQVLSDLREHLRAGADLPEIEIIDDKSSFLGWFYDSDWTVKLNSRFAASFLHMKGGARAVSARLAADPAARRRLVAAADVLVLHELVHAYQTVKCPACMLRLNGKKPVEFEYEAYLRQAMYLHEKLLSRPRLLRNYLNSGAVNPYLESALVSYITLSLSREEYKKSILERYSAEENYSLVTVSSETAVSEYSAYVDDFYKSKWPAFSVQALEFLGDNAVKTRHYQLALKCLAVAEATAKENGVSAEELHGLQLRGVQAMMTVRDYFKDNGKYLRAPDAAELLVALEQAHEKTSRPFPRDLQGYRNKIYRRALPVFARRLAKAKDPDTKKYLRELHDYIAAHIPTDKS